MRRFVTLLVDITDDELAHIVPSGTITVDMYSQAKGGYTRLTIDEAEVISVKDLPSE